MVTAFLGMGANVGAREDTMCRAIEMLNGVCGIDVVTVSPVYETAPVGVLDQPDFLNAVLQIQTALTASALLDQMLAIEQHFGRIRKKKWGPRTLDLDILLYGEEVIDEPGLQVPHPHLHKRAFVLVPLCDLLPEGTHPAMGKSFWSLMTALDTHDVRQISGLDLIKK